MNWSYIAGFFDGEGSLCHNGKGFRVTIPQTSRPVLKETNEFVGYGNIIYLPKRKIHWSDGWTYYIAKQSEVYAFLKKIYPYIIVKKNLVKKTIPKLRKTIEQQKFRKKVYNMRKGKGKKLRSEGLTYREIGRQLKMDWGYARRLILDIN